MLQCISTAPPCSAEKPESKCDARESKPLSAVSKALGLPLSRGKRGKALGGVCAVFKKVVRHLGTPHRRPARRPASARMQGYCNIASCRMRINPPNLQRTLDRMSFGLHVNVDICLKLTSNKWNVTRAEGHFPRPWGRPPCRFCPDNLVRTVGRGLRSYL